MTAQLLDGRPVARLLKDRARAELVRFRNAYSMTPRLAIVLIGDDPSAHAYQNSINRVATVVGIETENHDLPAIVDQHEVSQLIDDLNGRQNIHGVMVLQPLPPHLSRVAISDQLDPLKDVDGITTFNAGRLFHDDRDVLAPSTPAGGMALLKHYQIPITGQRAVVVGRSPVVGRPMAAMLLAENATVTICHSRTRDLASITREADILVSAVGRPGTIYGSMVKPGATVVDFGVNFIDDHMVGDIQVDSVSDVAGRLTPVPGGTGRVTTAVLMRNTIKAATLQCQRFSEVSGNRDGTSTYRMQDED